MQIEQTFNHLDLPDDRIYLTMEELSRNINKPVSTEAYIKYMIWTSKK